MPVLDMREEKIEETAHGYGKVRAGICVLGGTDS